MSTSWIEVNDYRPPHGWTQPEQASSLARNYCAALERGEVLYFPQPPFDLPTTDREYLLDQQWSELRMHKNVSYRPADDTLRGVSGNSASAQRIHAILRKYSSEVISFLSTFLAPYAGKWIIDFASFRPLEEDGRALPLHKRNDLLHVDAFPSRPTRGGRILRVFTNLNLSKPRVWEITGPFDSLAQQFAAGAGLNAIASKDSVVSRTIQNWGARLGVRGMGRTPYDLFMLRFHDYLKENSAFQQNCSKVRLEFPPMSTWIVYTDGVAHAVMSGQYAMEQTFLIPANGLVSPQEAPYKVLENIAGKSLIR
ncbi:MAG TPA: Kdo hydroxylase family protein [Candidatus Acidoferrales bacterium]|nr:Kdo hydroxylase family protein [Candidatus Acidoferrales bacterium]